MKGKRRLCGLSKRVRKLMSVYRISHERICPGRRKYIVAACTNLTRCTVLGVWAHEELWGVEQFLICWRPHPNLSTVLGIIRLQRLSLDLV